MKLQVIKLDHTPFTFIKHEPFQSFEQMIGTLGGHAGIWLGLSVITVFNITDLDSINKLLQIITFVCERGISNEENLKLIQYSWSVLCSLTSKNFSFT
jgi:choline-glycine betaine transporter